IYTKLSKLSFEKADDRRYVFNFKPFHHGGKRQGPSKIWPLLKKCHMMPSHGCYSGGLHAGGPSAYHEYLLLFCGFGDFVSIGAKRSVDPAGPWFTIALIAVVAMRAGLDIIESSFGYFVRVLRVGEKTPVHADQVRFSFAQCLLSEIRIQSAYGHDRH